MNFRLPQISFSPEGAEGGGNSSGGGAVPSAAPSPASPSSDSSPSISPSDGGGESGIASSVGEASQDFAFIFGDDVGDGDPPPAEPLVTPPPVKPTEPKGPEAPKPVVVVPPVKPDPVVAAQTQPAAAPAASSLDAFDPSALAQALIQNEGAAIQHVADTLFKLSPEEIDALENDTVSAIPKLLAKGMVKGQLNMLQQLSRLIPTMIQRHGETMQRHSANESKFYQRWPDLKSDLHGPMVLKYGAVYRQMHPEASLETMIEELGPMVMMAAKVQPSVATQAKPASRNGRPPPASPFMPAGAVAAGAIPQQANGMSDIEAMFLRDDE